MGRQIDFSKPLDEDEAAYVRDRPWLLTDAELNGIEVTYAGDSFETEDASDEEDDESEEDDEDDDDEDESDDADDADEEEEDDEELSDSYDEFELPQLKELATERGISKAGSKRQIVARLRQQDSE